MFLEGKSVRNNKWKIKYSVWPLARGLKNLLKVGLRSIKKEG